MHQGLGGGEGGQLLDGTLNRRPQVGETVARPVGMSSDQMQMPTSSRVCRSSSPGLRAAARLGRSRACRRGSSSFTPEEVAGAAVLVITGDAHIEHWNGTSWKVVSSPSPLNISTLNSIATVSAKNIWAVGEGNTSSPYHTLIEHWNGKKWKVSSSPNNGSGSNYLYGVSAFSANNIWSVRTFLGSIDQTLTEFYC